MVQPRSAAGRAMSSRAHTSNAASIVEHTGNIVALPAKRRRRESVAASKKRHRREQRGLCELNLDELYIIFAYIYPMDLLNLTRTCKSLRDMLMHKSSRFLWKSALRQIEGLPPCPTDLTEPEYTNLVFYTRCHGCDKPAKTVFWNMRRRYCPACRNDRLCLLRFCDVVIRENEVLPGDWFTICDDPGRWVDRDQMDSFMREYRSAPNKETFLNEKREQYQAINLHARDCETWQQKKGRVHRFDLEVLRKERQTSIFDRLKQRGYEREIAYFNDELIEKSYRPVFRKHKPLTDSEWARMWPTWAKIMNNFRMQRLDETLYRPRRRLLVSEYDKYVTHPSPDSPTHGFLPHVAGLAQLPRFKDVLRAPENTPLDDKPFASAFAQLPILADEWSRKLESEIAGLVKIPACLSLDIAFSDVKISNTRHIGSPQTDLDKLHLACAIFHVDGTGPFSHPEILSVLMGNDTIFPNQDTHLDSIGDSLGSVRCQDSERTGSIYDRYGLQFLDEAPYIIYACGLDPSVATADDMDRRNARLRCLCCGGHTLVMKWRHAIWHARFYHCIGFGLAPLAQLPRWQLVSDEHIDAVQAVERSVQKAFSPDWARCLLCRPRIGDAMLYNLAIRHIVVCHGVAAKEGIHYKLVGIRDVCVVEMVERGGQVAFRELRE